MARPGRRTHRRALRAQRDGPGHVAVEIADTGPGIPAEHIGKVFDPFFTTKPIGKGTGLGLSIAHGIVEKHEGELTVASILGGGTTFRVRLPRWKDK